MHTNTLLHQIISSPHEDVIRVKVKKLKEADLYSAFIEVPYTQGAQVRITQCYLQTTPYLPLPLKHSPDGESGVSIANHLATTDN